jgi:hypothetical protein
MMNDEDSSLLAFLRSIMQLLVNKDYAALEQMSARNRLSALVMDRAVSEYGLTLVMPPADAFRPDIVPVTGNEVRMWSVVLPLFSIEEGASDLCLELTVRRLDNESFDLEVDDLHVR